MNLGADSSRAATEQASALAAAACATEDEEDITLEEAQARRDSPATIDST